MDFFLKVDCIPRRVGVFRILNDLHGLKKPQAKFQEKKDKNLKSFFFLFCARNSPFSGNRVQNKTKLEITCKNMKKTKDIDKNIVTLGFWAPGAGSVYEPPHMSPGFFGWSQLPLRFQGFWKTFSSRKILSKFFSKSLKFLRFLRPAEKTRAHNYEPGFFWLVSAAPEISRFLKEIFITKNSFKILFKKLEISEILETSRKKPGS